MKLEKPIGVAVCAGVFFLLLGIVWMYLKTSGVFLEPFESKSVTRASDCQCLPGYIPSNLSVQPNKVLGVDFQYIQINGPTKIRWGKGNTWIEKEVSKGFYATPSFFGIDPLPGVQKQVEEIGTKPSNTFFCQKLGDPSTSRPCY
jgi:hypothetical protein